MELGDQPLSDVLWDLFGELSLMEIFFLYQEIENHQDLRGQISWAKYFQKQKRFFNDKVAKLFKALSIGSSAFLTWCDSKKMENKDLYPLCSLKEKEHQELFTQLSSFFPEQNMSRSEGREALDLLVDLILMNKIFEELKPNSTTHWVSRLRQLRNPNTTLKDQTSTTINQAWPQFVKVKKQRQGDRLIHQMEIQFLNQEDLESKLSRLKPQGPKQ